MSSFCFSFFLLTEDMRPQKMLSQAFNLAGHSLTIFQDLDRMLAQLCVSSDTIPQGILLDKNMKDLPNVAASIHSTNFGLPLALFGEEVSTEDLFLAMHIQAVDFVTLSTLDKTSVENVIERLCAAFDRTAALHARIRDLETKTAHLEQAHLILDARTLKAEQDAEEAESTKALILANMSHELRTPLNSILGFSDLLLESNDHPQCQEYLEYIKSSGQHLLESINDLLDLSDIGSGRLVIRSQAFDLPPVLQALGSFLNQRAAAKGIVTLLDIAENIPATVVGDCERIKQVLLEFFSNAVRFTDSGTIELRVHCAPQSFKQDKVHIHFEVRDTGIGIAADKLHDVFSCFTIAEDHLRKGRCGAGLGLAVCHDLIEQMGGTVDIQSEPGAGTAISFALPFTIPARMLRTSQPLSLLVAEDNPLNLEFLSCLLRDLGHEVYPVRDGIELLAALKKRPFDMIMLDIQLPRLDGLTAAQRIRNNTSGAFDPNIPIIAVTAYNMPGDKQRFLDAGMNGYIKKPLDRYSIKLALAEVLGEQINTQTPHISTA
ncbi:response regulator [Desulfovibrio inopinatus]|uniref:response regulator n=1 Tax=Desulfovibrio inopinatus TaxID=102109 RepID=UPI000407366E|nr:response regulator [Desulfovibrio inopinatus]